MTISIIGLDLGKSVFQVRGVDVHGKVVVAKQLRRGAVLRFFANLPPCLVGLEACATAHHWARAIGGLGHQVRLMPPQYVKPYVKRSKTDRADGAATPALQPAWSTASRSRRRLRAVERLNLAFLVHRQHDRVARRGHLPAGLSLKPGKAAPQGIGNVRELIARLADAEEVPPMAHGVLQTLIDQLRHTEARITELDTQLAEQSRRDETSQRLMSVPGVGPIVATALVATIGDARTFRSGRHLAAWIGLVPGQRSTGGKERLVGITKAGARDD